MSMEMFNVRGGVKSPWVSAFGRAGVEVHVERRDTCSVPYATLPSCASVEGLGGLASWFSVAAEAAARGFYTRVVDQPVAIQSPASELSVASEHEETSAAYTQPDEEVQAAIQEVARAIDGRALPADKSDIVGGDCYLALVAEEHHDEARKRFGLAPSLRELSALPLDWLRAVHECARVGVIVRGSVLHMQDGGGDGILSGLDLLLAARVTQLRLRPERLPDVLMDARVAGGTRDWLSDLTDRHPVYHTVEGEAAQRNFIKQHLDAGSCFGALVRDWFGNVGLRESPFAFEVLPWDVLDRLLQRRVGTSLVTLYVSGRTACIVPGAWKESGGRVCAARVALQSLYVNRYEFCSQFHGANVRDVEFCGSCGFPDTGIDHGGRCRIPSSISVEAHRDSYLGDAVHTVDVRSAVLTAGVSDPIRTRVATLYCSAAGQAAFVRAFGAPCDITGWSDKRVSDHFEAWYVRHYRAAYVWWLARDVGAAVANLRGYLTDVEWSVGKLKLWCNALKGVCVAGVVRYDCHLDECVSSFHDVDAYLKHMRAHGVEREFIHEPFYVMSPVSHEGYTLQAMRQVFPYASPDCLQEWFASHDATYFASMWSRGM